MYELSLNIMDIAQNSIRANAKNVTVRVDADAREDRMRVAVEDDGDGMGDEALRAASDPFYTTRTTRKVGLGLPYFEMVAGMCGGTMDVWSKLGEGTRVAATMRISHIDRAPLGDMGQTVALLAGANPDVDFAFELSVTGQGGEQGAVLGEQGAVLNEQVEERKFRFDTREIKAVLDGVGIDTPEVVVYMENYINESILSVTGGVEL
jgi:hypothetical protein